MQQAFHILSDDVLREILLFLSIEDLPSVLLADRHMNQIVDCETQWRLVYLSLATPLPTPLGVIKKDDNDIQALADSLSNVSVSSSSDDKKNLGPQSPAYLQQQQQPKDKLFPSETWKYNVRMTRHHRWSQYFIDSDGNKIMNELHGPIIDESGQVLRFTENDRTRIYRIANILRPINTRATTRIDLKVKMCIEDYSKASTSHSFCTSWVLLGVIEESILRDLYTSTVIKSVYLGEFQPGENIGYANNGYFSRKKKNQWTDKFYSGDVISFIVDAEHGYEEAKESNWKKPYGRLTALLNGVEDVVRTHTGIFATPDARLYFCTQVNEGCHESGIVTTIQHL